MPFVWTADPDKIIAGAARGHQVMESIRQAKAEHKTASDPIANTNRPLAMREPSTQAIRDDVFAR
jgi:hypothetical protein